MSSILTDTSSMVVLQARTGLNKSRAGVRSAIPPGPKISAAEPAAATGAIAATMTPDAGADKTMSESPAAVSAQVCVEGQNALRARRTDAIEAAVDADVEEASARLTALQTRRPLGVRSPSFASQAGQSALSPLR